MFKLGEGRKEKLDFLQLFICSCKTTNAKLQPYVKIMSLSLFILISRTHKPTNLKAFSPKKIDLINERYTITEFKQGQRDTRRRSFREVSQVP